MYKLMSTRKRTWQDGNGASGSPTKPEAPPRKKRHLIKDADLQEEVEKRAARFKKACPKNILERKERVMSQR